MRKNFNQIICGIVATIFTSVGFAASAFADVGISVSPMIQKIILNPGESYTGSFTVFNQASNQDDLIYETEVIPFFADENYDAIYEKVDNYNQIVDWITVDNGSGVLLPNSGADIIYTINVPNDAPAGGQYAAIRVLSVNEQKDNDDGMSANINVRYGIAYTIFAEISGVTKKQGEIIDVDIPSFMLSGNIMGVSTIQNTGNVHSEAKYTLQVFPLFSDEEIYTNEESPATRTILPNRTLYNEVSWSDTPAMGIFNVIYTVEFEGVTTQVSKMVIKCPIWLLFIIIFVIFAIIIWMISRARSRRKLR